jgi:hypothetical protein
MNERIINKTLCFNSPKATIQKEKENENPYHVMNIPRDFLSFFSKKNFYTFLLLISTVNLKNYYFIAARIFKQILFKKNICILKIITFALTNLENALFFKHIIFVFVGDNSKKKKSANFSKSFRKLSKVIP